MLGKRVLKKVEEEFAWTRVGVRRCQVSTYRKKNNKCHSLPPPSHFIRKHALG